MSIESLPLRHEARLNTGSFTERVKKTIKNIAVGTLIALAGIGIGAHLLGAPLPCCASAEI